MRSETRAWDRSGLSISCRQGSGRVLVKVRAPGLPGVESQQLAVHKQEGMQGLLAAPLGAGVDSLNHMSLKRLDAQFTELGVNQPLHCLARDWQQRTACQCVSSCWRLHSLCPLATKR